MDNSEVFKTLKKFIKDIYGVSNKLIRIEGDTSIHIFEDNDEKGYNSLINAKVGDTYAEYSIDLKVPCKDQMIYIFEVVGRITDEQDNTIIFLSKKDSIDFKI